jgi:glutamate-1-semialdehyde 2,1-aminomutase
MDEQLLAAYRNATPQSRELHQRATEVMPGGDTRSVTYHRPYPSYVASASGCRLTTEDGDQLLDFLNNYTQTVLGHAPPAVVERVTERFAAGNGLAAPTAEAIELAEMLVERVPSLEQVRFGNSGTEATMNAIRGAMAYTGNETVLKIHGGYHGTHDTVEVAVESTGREHVGIPTDVESRVEEHDRGEGAKYTRGRTPVELAHRERFDSRSAAMQREAEIKSLARREKRQLVRSVDGHRPDTD